LDERIANGGLLLEPGDAPTSLGCKPKNVRPLFVRIGVLLEDF
jgi:hypothetical protein